ncbi:MAG: SpoIID/LytB domain-containing protein [Anaerolineae bacterium]
MNSLPSKLGKLLWPWGVAGMFAACLALALVGAGATTSPGVVSASALYAQSDTVLAGQVINVVSGAPIPGAIVSAAGISAAADEAGNYRLALPLGTYTVRAEAPGYIGMTYPGEVLASGQTRRDIQMVPLSPDDSARAALAAMLPRAAEAQGGESKSAAVPLGPITSVPSTVRVLMPDGHIETMDMDNYLKGVVPFEIGPSSPTEAQKAQAVAARTYAATHCLADSAGDPTRCEPGVDANVDTTTRTQVWRSSPRYDTSNAAVDATSGVVLRQNGVLASSTVYFGHTTRATRDNEDVFGGPPVSYLRSVGSPDPYNRLYGHGVGMSQVGAMVLADWGASYADILRHYYTGLSVDRAVATATPTATPAASSNASSTSARAGVLHSEWSIADTAWARGTAEKATVAAGRLAPQTAGEAAIYTTEPLAADFEFQAISVHWEPPAPARSRVGVEVRISADGKSWTPWRDVPEPDGGREDISDRASDLHFETGRFAQVRLTLDPGTAGVAPSIDRLHVHYFDGRQGPTSADLAARAASASKSSDLQPPIVPREAWGAPTDYVWWDACYSSGRTDQDGYIRPNAFAVHHTADDHSDIDGAAWVRIVYNEHAVIRGWGDIGYHYVVDRNGVIYQGRTPGNPPAGYIAEGGHALQYNCGSAGIVALGNYQPNISIPLTPLTAQTRQGLVNVTAWLMHDYGVRPWDQRFVVDKTVLGMCGHRDLLQTQCPGDDLYALLDGLRNDVQAILDAQPGDVPTPTLLPPPSITPLPTDTPTPTARPAEPIPSTPVATPQLGAGCQNILPQGDFTSYDQWTLNAAYVTQTSALSAPLGLFLGRTQAQQDLKGWSSATSAVTVLPSSITRGRLAFWYAPYSDSADGDRFIVELHDGNGNLLPNGRLVDDKPPHNYRGWTYFDRDVTSILQAAAGQSVSLYLGVYNDGNGLKSYVRVDDITLEVCGGPTATPTLTPTRTPTPTVTPTRTLAPSPTPVPVSCSDWTINGSFDTLDAGTPRGWSLQPADLGAGVTTGQAASSSNALRLGGEGTGFGFAAAWQDFVWPSGVTSATLSVSYMAQGGADGDTRVVELRDVLTGQRVNLLRLSGAGDGVWHQVDIPIASRPDGHPVEVYFAVTRNSAAQPTLLIDSVSLRLCGSGLGGPYRLNLPHIMTEWDWASPGS